MEIKSSLVNLSQMGNVICPQDWKVVEEGHSFNRMKYIYAGEAYYEDETTKEILLPSHIYIMPSNARYRLYHNKKNPLRCLWFHLIITPKLSNSLISFDASTSKAIQHLLCAIESMCEEDNLNVSSISAITEQILRHINRLGGLSYITDERILRAINHFHDSIKEGTSLNDVAKVSSLAPEYFNRLFKSVVGISPMRYFTQIRLEQSKRFLLEGMSVSRTSIESGFLDEKHFSKQFKRYVGVSPSLYMKSQNNTP